MPLLHADIHAPVAAPATAQLVALYDGSWRAHLVDVGSALGPAADRTITIVNRCSIRDTVAACEQRVDGEPAGTVEYRPITGRIFALSNVGSYGMARDGGRVAIGNRRVTYTWTQRQAGKSFELRIVNRWTDPNTIAFEKWFRPSGAHRWIRVGWGSEHRSHQAAADSNATSSPFGQVRPY